MLKRKNISYVLFGVLVTFFPLFIFAADLPLLCKKSGYTISTVNGVFTDEEGARNNQRALFLDLGDSYKGEKLDYQYLLNPSHLGGIGDILASAYQKVFEDETVQDYDLIEMLGDASAKVKTQKLLLVAYSQGNFYANSFYDLVADQSGGVPAQSIAVYSVANPASRVAGEGKWITSDTDKVISNFVARVPFKKIMPPNTHIALQPEDDPMGHSFSSVYLKYRATKIVTDIQSSLDNLSSDPERREDMRCIDPPTSTVVHKVTGVVLAVADPVATVGVKTVGTIAKAGVTATVWAYNTAEVATIWTYNTGVAIAKAVGNVAVAVASTLYAVAESVVNNTGNLADNNSAAVILATQGSTKPAIVDNQSKVSVATSTNKPLSAVKKLSTITLPQSSAGTSGSSDIEITTPAPAVIPTIATKTIPSAPTSAPIPKLALVGSYTSGGGGGGSSPRPAQQVSDTTNETEEIPPATSREVIIPPNGIISATTTAQTYTENPVTFLGTYYNDTTFDSIIFELKNTTLDTATSSFERRAQATTTGELLSFDENIEIPSSGTWEYRIRLEDRVNASSTPWLASNVFSFMFATTTATSTESNIESRTEEMSTDTFEDSDPANLLHSDLNQNGIADSEEDYVVASTSASLPAGEYVFKNLTITNSATITLEGDLNSVKDFKGVKIFARNLTVDAGASISADSEGYGVGAGPGAPATVFAGASYGGLGYTNTATSTYGSAARPIDLGSGGNGSNPHGGGAISLVITGTLSNNGTVSANGSNTSSGGSIYITAGSITGLGSYRANGGHANCPNICLGPGGGGRIAIYYQTSTFTGSAIANGMSGWGGASEVGTVGFFDTSTNDLHIDSSWRFQKKDEPFNFNRIVVDKGASITMDDGVVVTADELVIRGEVNLSKGSLITISKITLDGGTFISSGEETIISNTLILANSAVVTVVLGQTLTLLIPKVTIDSRSLISVTEKGDNVGAGFAPIYSAGGSYGGVGLGNTATSTYGSAREPSSLGSGGGAPHARGGGALRLVATDTLMNNGTIAADGNISSSGGSIYVTANNVTGSGVFHANGGNLGVGGYFSGAGGGGRIAVYYQTASFTGLVEALGGCGSYDGFTKACAEKGTVVMEKIGDIPAIPSLPPTILSSARSLTTFSVVVATSTISGVIDETAHTINVTVPFDTDIRTLAPFVEVSPLATSSPVSGAVQDFTDSVVYTVTAEDGSTEEYVVTVTVMDEPAPDIVPPTIVSYIFNGREGDITADFATTTPAVSIALTASENVDWVSIIIEDQSNPDNHKTFFSGDGCVDDTAVCIKSWNGILSPVSKNRIAPDGVYHVKVRIRDTKDPTKNSLDYLAPYFITVNTTTPSPQ